MVVDYWNDEVRKELMQYLIHNLKVTEEIETEDGWEDHSDFKGLIIEPASPPPRIPIQRPDDKVFEIKW